MSIILYNNYNNAFNLFVFKRMLKQKKKKKNNNVLVYIRHGQDQMTEKHIEDDELVYGQRKHFEKVAKELIDKYGLPCKIITSPFSRAVDTQKLFRRVLKRKYKHRVEKELDGRLGRLFTSSEKQNLRVNKNAVKKLTKKYMIVDQNKYKFRQRVSDQVMELSKDINSNRDNYVQNEKGYVVIWNICHALTFKQVARTIGKKAPNHVDFLETLAVRVRDNNNKKHQNNSISSSSSSSLSTYTNDNLTESTKSTESTTFQNKQDNK